MKAFSWFRRYPGKDASGEAGTSNSRVKNSSKARNSSKKEEEAEQLYGITEQLLEFVKTFSDETFRNYSLPDEKGGSDHGGFGNVRKDLSDWEERHAMLILYRVNELSQIRFKLCPRYLKEREFWTIYFLLVKSYVVEYQLHAARIKKLQQMRTEQGSDPIINSAYEVEMSEAKWPNGREPASSEENADSQ